MDGKMEKMNMAVIDSIKNVLRSSPFGSGELAADFFPWEREEELCKVIDGLYIVEVGDYDNVEVRFVSPENKDYPCLNRGISWRSEIRVPYEISNGTLMVVLGCGVHSAIYEFNLSTGEVVDISPDVEPSFRFYCDGDNINSDKRKAYLMKLAKA
jgi:hypothetical protein